MRECDRKWMIAFIAVLAAIVGGLITLCIFLQKKSKKSQGQAECDCSICYEDDYCDEAEEEEGEAEEKQDKEEKQEDSQPAPSASEEEE